MVKEAGFKARYIKLIVVSLPYEQAACVSGLRVFGLGDGSVPAKATDISAKRIGDLDLDINWRGAGNGYVVVCGYASNKLYHSCQVFGESVRIGGLVKDQETYIRIDSFNEFGITEGDIVLV